MNRSCAFRYVFAVCILAPTAARADVELDPLFTDHAVLQQGMKVPVFGTADPGEEVTVRFQGQVVKWAAGPHSYWRTDLAPLKPGGPFQLTVEGRNKVTVDHVFVGEVWICSGQSNMEWPMRQSHDPESDIAAAANPKIHLFKVPHATAGQPLRPLKTVKAKWEKCTPQSVAGFSAVGYYFGRDLQKHRNMPVGLIQTTWGGTPAQAWTSKEALDAEPALRHYHERLGAQVRDYDPERAMAEYQVDLEKYTQAAEKAKAEGKPAPRKPQMAVPPDKSPSSPSTLYNAMLDPLMPFAIRGAIWYQGESNAGQAHEYRTLFPAMIRDWRAQWGQGDFPFLCVQLAPFRKISPEPQDSDWAELREAQLLTTQKLPHVGMAVITDAGDENDVHPRKKAPVGERLALLARKCVYGENVAAKGPVYKSMKVEGNRAILNFDHVGSGLAVRGERLTGFAVCGEDKKFVNAEADIRSNTVVVHSPQVEKPIAVRFGWANYPVVNLWNKDGLPATPFRTDDFPGVTGPNN